MRKSAGVAVLLLALLAVRAKVILAQGQAPDPVSWAYGFVVPGPDPVAPPCSPDTKPHDCSKPGRPWPDDGTLLHLPGSDQSFTISQVQSFWAPADWFPGEHPPAPDIVKYGHEKDHLRACGHCHYFNGLGKPENGHLAGLPVNYFLQQMALFKSGGRKSADPRKANANEMAQIARFLSDEETKAAAEYYSSLQWRPWTKVVESATAPKTRQSPAGMFLPLDGGQSEPLGERIIEVPQDSDRTERLRDPHSGFLAYVPIGSVAKGNAIVNTGASGKTVRCATCHGADLRGMGDVPAIAGRTTSYLMRQLYNYKMDARQSTVMKPVVEKLSTTDMISIVAYLGSL